MKSILRSILHVVFPEVCAGCKAILNGNERLLCSYCRYEMPKTNFLTQPNNEAYKKFYGIVPVNKVAALLYFEKDGITQHILHQLKYKNQPELGALLANMFADALQASNFFPTNCCLIPVPLHPKRLKQRGYNQIHAFAKTLAKNHNLEINKDILVRNLYNKTQTKKNLTERNLGEKPIFGLSDWVTQAQHFVLIDDVLTTGSTLIQCAKVLQQIPDAEVSILTLAYAH
ncbi:ComF family protein [Flavobacterium agricola]|uniref:ComF family protein n=1 Tax=Flavobacterium agricola TaxID=2870839 RepID=A0ABY6LZG6_9FLAO|nr:ComF family protein [Flavobacterium agricola]UYW00804.1 ComF family protein [Flavobacterium agricola]